MDSIAVLSGAVKKCLLYGQDLSEEERVLVENAGIKVGELLRLTEEGRLEELHGATPADLVRKILRPLREKSCGCPTCRARGILDY